MLDLIQALVGVEDDETAKQLAVILGLDADVGPRVLKLVKEATKKPA